MPRRSASTASSEPAREPALVAFVERLLAALEVVQPAGRRKEIVQPGEVVSEDRAARALPIRRADAVGWLRREGLSVPLEGRRVVVWDRVLERLGSSPAPSPRRPSRTRRDEPLLLAVPGRMFG